MKKFSRTILICTFAQLLICTSTFAQQNKIDSLLNLIKTDIADTNKLIHLYNLSDEYETIGNFDEGLNYGNKTILLVDAILNMTKDEQVRRSAQKYKAMAYTNLGIIYTEQGNYPEALKNHFACLKMYEAIGDKKGISSSYNNIGIIYKNQGNYTEALKNQLESLKIEIELGDKKGEAYSYHNLGNIYKRQGNYEEALKKFLASLEIRIAIDDKKGISASYNDIAGVYSEQGNYSEALINLFASLKIRESIGSKADIAATYGNIGNVLIQQKKYKKAKEYITKAKNISKEIGYKEYISEAYFSLSELDLVTGDFKGAYENHKLYILYRDSLDNEETRKKTIQSQMTFDFEKKEAVANAEHKKELENQQVLAEEKNRKQKVVTAFVVCGLLLVLLFAGFIFRSLRITSKQKDIIEEQKEFVEHQKNLVEEHQKEIIDSITYAKRIQYSLLANKQLLSANLPDHFVLFKPKDIVSGDFYWATEKSLQSTVNKEEKIKKFYIAACDSTGHGVPGAFMSLLNISFLNEAVNEKNIVEPHEILDHVRKRLIENMDGGQDGMDCILIKIETQTSNIQHPISSITYAAANNSPTIIKNGKLISLDTDKMPVGKGEKTTPFTLRTIELEKGDSLYLYTDGYADQFGGPKGKKFKYKQLNELLVSVSNLPATEQSEILNQRFDDWKGNLEQVDDMLVIGIKI